MEGEKDGHAGGGGGGANDDIQFISPSNSPTATNPPQSVSSPLESQLPLFTKAMSGVSTSDSSAVGINSRDWVEPPDLDTPSQFNSEKESIEEQLDESNSNKTREKKHVKFRDENITSHFDDTNLWVHDPNESAQDMINAYQRECMAMKIKPTQILLDQLKGVYNLNTPIDTIDLTGVKLENRMCEVLEAVLSRVHASTLKLERTNLEDEGMIAICEMVEFYGCACKLLLAHNNRLRPRAWLTIGRTLKKSPFIDTIDVGYCALDDQTLTLLLRAVRANCGLRVLKMEGNNLTGKGTFILMAAMKFNENLQEIYLSRNHLGPEDGQHLGNILRSNHTLRVLDVSDNNLQDSGIRYISAGIAEQQEGLYTLNISTNNLTADGIHHISAMLPCTRTLRDLNISNNRFGDNGLFMLKLGILANRSVEKLVLSGTKVTCEGAIALAEVLAESRYLVHVDLRENEIRIAGLMALCLALRMNHKLLHLETPKTFKVEQRDRQLIKDLLGEMEKYRARNHKEKEEREREEAKRIHEASHNNRSAEGGPDAVLPSSGSSGEDHLSRKQAAEEEEEEKEVDPSLVGSLDNVYTDETEAELNKEDDPFKKVAVSGMTTPAEMEKTVNALVIYSSETDDRGECLSPLPDDQDTSLEGRRGSDGGETQEGVDLLGPSSPAAREEEESTSSGSGGHPAELLPDLISSPVAGALPDVQVNHSPSLPPDITPSGTLPPDLAAESRPLDLLNPEGGMPSSDSPLDLTDGLLDA
ncbi:PREDICTED: protein phosphatase 1 regulatory subunit 37-like isoform X2 [Amphimedon queenslandica]|uniref:Protein phosphatase 1 regulatory subunit 37 n=1 Tax=Amphimedon queenslandica TaxID=400682 RepID=A0AAN0IC22_AMPQE|nr:PREDICTED: protein phosphatase 1 regulatory subunit 37-like isoform X2 [Amphimedon queenslandica]|eukprot:XP_003385088.1 PREDICTED: protein phosphatase 1 regulatory subunit 37-like isoform X2 [Amphimedon queenslandica]